MEKREESICEWLNCTKVQMAGLNKRHYKDRDKLTYGILWGDDACAIESKENHYVMYLPI